jgi:hypothetical protein
LPYPVLILQSCLSVIMPRVIKLRVIMPRGHYIHVWVWQFIMLLKSIYSKTFVLVNKKYIFEHCREVETIKNIFILTILWKIIPFQYFHLKAYVLLHF